VCDKVNELEATAVMPAVKINQGVRQRPWEEWVVYWMRLIEEPGDQRSMYAFPKHLYFDESQEHKMFPAQTRAFSRWCSERAIRNSSFCEVN
jgi:hypothetical protein